MDKYFNYPLSLMQFIKDDADKEGLLKIIAFSTLNFSEKMNFSRKSVANQIIYLYYRRDYFLDNKLNNYISEMFDDGRLIEDEDYHGFANDTFNPEQENEGMLLEFESNPDFYYQCVTTYREHQALSLLSLNPELKPDLKSKYEYVKSFIETFEGKNGADAWTSIPNNLIFDVYNGKEPMDLLRLIASVKSVLSKKNLNLTYKSVQLCRMFGCKKMNILNELFTKNPELKAKHDFLSRRRQWDNLINSAEAKSYLSYYPSGRGFFVSVSMSKDELEKTVEIRQKNYAKINIKA